MAGPSGQADPNKVNDFQRGSGFVPLPRGAATPDRSRLIDVLRNDANRIAQEGSMTRDEWVAMMNRVYPSSRYPDAPAAIQSLSSLFSDTRSERYQKKPKSGYSSSW